MKGFRCYTKKQIVTIEGMGEPKQTQMSVCYKDKLCLNNVVKDSCQSLFEIWKNIYIKKKKWHSIVCFKSVFNLRNLKISFKPFPQNSL